ncbi:cation/calcium exchanger 5 [Selaginella moellendorffii]|uniref:cation/calcium exchanger 5 n=1 Tax=Selaginella moellendorffii TaxID=88036 RepID=UPI000D1C5D60|nr:cation/calcium exchanger 5 [Selaginella moellendorffii]|eukprot:XP_024536665.1 cation/calcium exchanger 5 [Selaginella moellendorffii]
MEDSDRRTRARRRFSVVIPQLVLLLVLGFYRVWTASAQLQSLRAAAAPGGRSRNARYLGEITNAARQNAAGLVESSEDHRHCASIDNLPPRRRCEHARLHCKNGRSVLNYVSLHYCALDQRSWLSVPLLLAAVLLAFFCLAETAERFFSPVATLMVEMLSMSPTMGGVTLLALGNGAPDVFASMAAIGGGNSRIGLGAIISAGTFVSAFVVGSVALVAAPFSVKPLPFVRDVVFYLAAVGLVFLVYMKGVVTFWQAVGFVSFYAVFIVVVVVMDLAREAQLDHDQVPQKLVQAGIDEIYVEADVERLNLCQESFRKSWKDFLASFWDFKVASLSSSKIRSMLQAPLHVILRATIPEINPFNWSRAYSTANFVFCPLLLLVMFRSMIPIDHPVVFFASSVKLPLWSLVLVQNLFLAAAFFVSTKQPPESTQFPVAFMAFVMSVLWISFVASELLGCLAALGIVLGVSPALLGLTVLAWGNSMGDLVADIAIARAGKPEMAIAGCFAGPMFNMLVGLGFALVLHTSYLEPPEYYLSYHPSLLIAFGFLFTGLVGSLLVVACSKFQVTRTWGLCLIGLYFIFTLVSVFSGTLS